MMPGMSGPNPMAGLPGIPPAQMQYLQRQFQGMAGQGLGGMPPMSGGMAPPSPAAGYPNFSGGQPGDLLHAVRAGTLIKTWSHHVWVTDAAKGDPDSRCLPGIGTCNDISCLMHQRPLSCLVRPF